MVQVEVVRSSLNSLCFEGRVTISGLIGYREDGGSAYHGYRVSVREDVKVLEMDDADSQTM